MSNRMSRTVSTAYAPVTALIVSQPAITQISEPGGGVAARPDRAGQGHAGAPPRLPAMPMRPTRPYGTIGAAIATTRACQKLSLYATTRLAPIVSSSTLMLAATHVGKELAGLGGALGIGDGLDAASQGAFGFAVLLMRWGSVPLWGWGRG